MRHWMYHTILEALAPSIGHERAIKFLTPEILRSRARTAHPPPHPCTCAPLRYRDTLVRVAMHKLKYKNSPYIGTLFGSAITPYVSELLAEQRMYGRFHTVLVTSVPLTKKRFHERGYNQAQIIAHAFLEELCDNNLEYVELLQRVHESPSQTTLSGRDARFKNLQGAFQAKHRVMGADVFLIDDVVTTGATLLSAQTELFRAGAREVICIAVAH